MPKLAVWNSSTFSWDSVRARPRGQKLHPTLEDYYLMTIKVQVGTSSILFGITNTKKKATDIQLCFTRSINYLSRWLLALERDRPIQLNVTIYGVRLGRGGQEIGATSHHFSVPFYIVHGGGLLAGEFFIIVLTSP